MITVPRLSASQKSQYLESIFTSLEVVAAAQVSAIRSYFQSHAEDIPSQYHPLACKFDGDWTSYHLEFDGF